MILVTGGAGFIGSNLHAALAGSGRETVVVDRLGAAGKWHNLAQHPPTELVHPDRLDDYLASRPPISLIYHLGAVSETTATDADRVWATNVALPLRLWRWCAQQQVRFIYASSAATYGDGAHGFSDDPALLTQLRPMNLYGWSKHVFDLRVQAMLAAGQKRPPQWAGLKFFNVYGPNEYHKAGMISVVKAKYDELMAGQPVRLFRSDRADIADGHQQRDFIWVGDIVDVLLWLLDTPQAEGMFNVGAGVARSYLELARAVCVAANRPADISFIDMPERLVGQYQSMTRADISRLRAAGYDRPFTDLDEGVRRYVQDYLARQYRARPDPWR